MVNQKNSPGNFFSKATCLLLIISFTLVNTSGEVLADALPAGSGSKPVIMPQDPLQALDSLRLPEELGSIQETYIPQGIKPQRFVAAIQDAHSIPDAQRNIQRIIDYFQSQYGIDSVAVEGSASELDPQMFKSFPDQEILKKVFEEYFDRGELTGSTAAAIFNDNAASYQGIEDWRLYQEGLRYFLETMEVQGPVLKKLDAASESLEEEKEKTYSEKLLEIDRVLMLFQKNEADLISVLSKLSSVRTPDKGSGLALLCEQSLRMTDHDLSVDLEVRKLADQIKQFFQMNPRASGVIAFNQQFQEFQTSRISPKSFALFLREEAKRQSIHVNISQRLTALISTHKRIRDIEGTQLWNELSAYSQSVKEALFRNEQERSLDRRSHRLDILNRLLKLELNREDWEEIKQYAAGMQWEHFDPLLQSMQPHLNFYENAEEREHAFGRQIDKLLKKSDSKSAVVILGGFHSKGIAQKMRLEGVSYALITPKIEHLPEAPLYREQMRGKVSWAKYFEIHEGRINLYNAFIRGTRDLLLQRAKDGRGTCLKLWRDKIIRDLAEQGRIAESIQYTRFLDEAARKHEADYAVQWESNIRQFIAGLRQFKTEGRLTEQNIANLLKVQSIPAGPTAAPVARNELRADLLLGVSHKVQPSDTPSEVSRSELRTEVPITDLVAYLTHPSNADLSALKQAIDSNASVQTILDQKPGNRNFHRDLLADFIHSIFSEEHRPLIEIVANAIDASTASGIVPRDIDVHLSSEGFEVIDTGTGMNLETVLTKLLIPMISGQEGIAGKHGRFGVGFFYVLNYLKTPQDRLIVQTSQGQGGGYTISFRTDGKQIYAALTPQRDLPQGTRVHLKTESFDTSKAAAILEDTFHAKAGVSIRLNQAVINHPEFYETILDAKGEGSIRVSQKKVTGKAKVIASVAGAKFFDIEIEGVDIPEEIVVDFPLSTPFPVSRNTFEVNQSLRNTIKMYIQKLSVREDALERLSQIAPLIEQINRKNPLRNKEGEDLVRILTDAAKKVPRQKDQLLLPADPAFQGVTIAGKRLRFTDRSFINEEDQEKWEPYLLPGFQSSISVYKVHFAGPAADKKVLRSLDAGYAFINEDYLSGTALNLAHWDLLLNKEGVLGAFASPEPEGAEKKQGESSTRGETKVIETEPAEDFSRLEGIPSPKSAEEAYRLITEHPFYGQPLLMHTETSEFTLDAEVFNEASRAFGFEWLFHLIYSFEEELVKSNDWGVVASTHFVRMLNSILSEMVTHYETHGRDEIILLHEKGLKAILSYHKKYPDITLTEWARVFFYDILVDPNYWSMVSAFAYLETFPEDIRRANHKTDYAAVMPAEKRSVSRGKFDLKNGPTESLWHVVEKVRHEVLGVPNYEGKVEALRNVARLRNLYITALERVPAETLNSFDVDSYFTSPGSLSGQFETMLAVFSGLEEFLYIKSLFTNVYTNKNHMREVPPEERILWEERFHYLVTRVFDGLDIEERRQLVRDFVDYAGWEGSGNASARIRPYLYFLKYGELVDIRDKPNLFESSRSQVPARQAQASIAALIADALQGGAEAVDADALWRKIQSLSGFRPSPSALKYAQLNLLHSVHFYTGEPRVYVRELIQNVLDEIKQRKLRSVGRKQLEISIFRDQRSKMLAVNFKDKLGVRFLDLIQTLLIPGASSKRLKEELLGRFGHGFFSIFQNAKAVTIRTSTGNGSSYLIQLEPYWNIENDRVEDIDFIVKEIKGKTEPGTEIELLLDIPKDDQEFEAAMIAYAVHEHSATVDEKDCKIILHGKKMNRPKELLAERETEIGKVSLYRLPEFQKVTVGDLHLRHLDEGYRGLIPPIARSILLPQGIVIDLGHGFKTIRDRSDLKDKNNLMPVIEEAVRQMTLEAIVRLFSLKGLDVEVLPYDYFSHFASYPIPHRVEQDGRSIGENQPIDYSYYSNDESRFGMLLVSVPFIKIKGEEYSLHSVLQILHDPSHAEFSFTDLPSELQEVFQRKRFDQELSAAQGMETMRTRRDSPSRFRRSLNEFEDREIPSDADRSRYGAYLAYNQFMKETMREAYRLAFGSEKDVRISFYRSGDRSLGHALQGQTRIGRNLALFGNESAAWKRILDDAASTHEEYLFWKASLETNYHELVHLGEKPSEAAGAVEAEWTHHPAFRAKELQVIESGLAGMHSLEIRRDETRRIFQGLGAISANLETFGAYLEGQSPRVHRSADRRSELRTNSEVLNQTANDVIDALNPQATMTLGQSEVRNIYEISTTDFDRFIDTVLERWAIRLKQGIGTEENLFVAKAALEESGKLIEHLRALRGSLPQGTITIGLRLTGRNNSSFLAQLFKVLQGESQNAEILAEAGTVKKLLTGEAAGNVAVRSVLPADWQRGFKALRSPQGVVPVALDDQFMNEKMEGMFNGVSLNWGETKPQGMVHDFGELLFAAALVEMAKIFSDPKHKDELLRLKSDSKATAEYLRAQLLERLAALDYPQDMFTYGENGYLTIQGVIANAFLEFKAELLINQAA